MNVLTSLIITSLSLTETYCIAWLVRYVLDRSAERTEMSENAG